MGPQTGSLAQDYASNGTLRNTTIRLGAALASVAVALRFFTRAKVTRQVGLDDHVMSLAMVSPNRFVVDEA